MPPFFDNIASAWTFVNEHRKSFAAMVCAYIAAHIILILPNIFDLASTSGKWYRVLLEGTSQIILAIISLAIIGWMIRFAINRLEQKPTTPGESFAESWQRFPAFLITTILGLALLVFGFLAFVIPGCIFFIWFAFNPYLIMLDKASALTAFQKSRALVVGQFLPAAIRRIGAVLFFVLSASFLKALFFLLIGTALGKPGVFFGAGSLGTSLSPFYKIAETAIASGMNALVLPFFITTDLLLLSDLYRSKAKREG